MTAHDLDVQGLNCPLPIMQAKKTMKALEPGDTLEVLATDPGSVKDFESFCRATGDELLESEEQGDVYRFLLKKKAKTTPSKDCEVLRLTFFAAGRYD